MLFPSVIKKTVFALFLFAISHISSATVYSNTAAKDIDDHFITVGGLGIDSSFNPVSSNFGQRFIAAETLLNSFYFHAYEGSRGNIRLAIAAWDGQKATGPDLFTSSAIFYGSSQQDLGASNINLSLTTGKEYIAYLSTANVNDPAWDLNMKTANSNGGLNGGFSFLNAVGSGAPSSSAPWTSSNINLNFSARFTTPVPEPESYALLGLGLFALWRKQAH